MSNFKLINTTSGAETTFDTKKEIIAILLATEVTDNSESTIEKKINTALKSGKTLYNGFKVEEVEKTNEENKSEEEVKMELNNQTEVQEIVEDLQEVVENIKSSELDTVKEIVDTVEEIVEQEYIESPEAAKEVEAENKEFAEVISGDKPEETPTESENKRKVGKGLIAYKNGEVYQTFPSIKACATHFKDLLNIGHMPFTPIMKSARQDVDWNEYSFKFENKADLHIPTPKTETPVSSEKTEDQPATEVKEEQIEEIIEEIPVEEV